VDQVAAAAAAGLPLDRIDVSPTMERLADHAAAAYREHTTSTTTT
jgi:hypothetical protein